jgi:hypothetical protein
MDSDSSYKIGEVKYGKDIGKDKRYRYVWSKCVSCGVCRRVTYGQTHPSCIKCLNIGRKHTKIFSIKCR